MAKYGWDAETSVTKALYTLAKETAESTTLKDAVLTNTQEGIQTQLDNAYLELKELPDGAAYDMKMDKIRGLIKKQAEMLENG